MLSLSKLLHVVGTRSFLFSLTIVSLLAAKLLHVFSHLNSTALPLFLLYFATYFTPDVFVIVVSRWLYQRSLVFAVLFWSVRVWKISLHASRLPCCLSPDSCSGIHRIT
jgi:hypothetical protein